MKTKERTAVIAFVAILLCISIIGTTMAYFTDTEEMTNTFTMGKGVDVVLTESSVADPTNNVVAATTIAATGMEYANVYPGQKLSKKVEIKPGTETSDFWAVAVVNVSNSELSAAGIKVNEVIGTVLTGGLVSKTTEAGAGDWANLTSIGGVAHYSEAKTTVDGAYVYAFYFNDPITQGSSAEELMKYIEVPGVFDNSVAKQSINVECKVYAVQKSGFANAREAFKDVFSDAYALTVDQ